MAYSRAGSSSLARKFGVRADRIKAEEDDEVEAGSERADGAAGGFAAAGSASAELDERGEAAPSGGGVGVVSAAALRIGGSTARGGAQLAPTMAIIHAAAQIAVPRADLRRKLWST